MAPTVEQMDAESARCAAAGDRVGAAVWRARAACTRAGWVLPERAGRQLELGESGERRCA